MMRFLKSVKFRITFYFAATFAAASLLCFLIVVFHQYRVQRSEHRQRLVYFLEEFFKDYLTGGGVRNTRSVISGTVFRGAAAEQTKKRLGGFVPLRVFSDRSPEEGYTAYGAAGGKIYAVTVRGNGESVAIREIPLAERIAALNEEFNGESYGEGTNRIFFLLISDRRKVLVRSPFSASVVHGFLERESLSRSAPEVWEEMVHCRNRDILTLNRRLPDGNVLVTGYNLRPLYRTIRSLAFVLAMMTLVISGIGALTGWLLSKRIMLGVDRVSRSAMRIASGDFSQRVAYNGEGAEVERLVDSFNTMAKNTEELLTELRTISDNIAHDLRTPVTRMRGQAELAVAEGRDSELAYDVAEECGNMLSMINTMLEITRLEAGSGKARVRQDLAALCRGAAELFSTVAEDRSIQLTTSLPGTLPFVYAKADLQRILANLLDNALKFTPPGGRVELLLRTAPDGVVLQVRDSGRGIPLKDQPHIFERFYRADSSRSLPGNGLGLSLVAAIVKSYDGSISFESSGESGTCFTIHLPAKHDSREQNGKNEGARSEKEEEQS